MNDQFFLFGNNERIVHDKLIIIIDQFFAQGGAPTWNGFASCGLTSMPFLWFSGFFLPSKYLSRRLRFGIKTVSASFFLNYLFRLCIHHYNFYVMVSQIQVEIVSAVRRPPIDECAEEVNATYMTPTGNAHENGVAKKCTNCTTNVFRGGQQHCKERFFLVAWTFSVSRQSFRCAYACKI